MFCSPGPEPSKSWGTTPSTAGCPSCGLQGGWGGPAPFYPPQVPRSSTLPSSLRAGFPPWCPQPRLKSHTVCAWRGSVSGRPPEPSSDSQSPGFLLCGLKQASWEPAWQTGQESTHEAPAVKSSPSGVGKCCGNEGGSPDPTANLPVSLAAVRTHTEAQEEMGWCRGLQLSGEALL